MSDFTVLRNGNEADLDRALAWVRGACTSGQEPLVAIIEQAVAAYRTKVVDVPAVPVQPAPNYRIQIEDGAWVGTLDERRALLRATGERAKATTFNYNGDTYELVDHAKWHGLDALKTAGWTEQTLAGSQYTKRVLAARPAPEYAVVTSDYADMLARDVSALMVEGWELQGGINAHYFNDGVSSWAQAMVRK